MEFKKNIFIAILLFIFISGSRLEANPNPKKSISNSLNIFQEIVHYIPFIKKKNQQNYNQYATQTQSNITVEINDKIYIKTMGKNKKVKVIEKKDKKTIQPTTPFLYKSIKTNLSIPIQNIHERLKKFGNHLRYESISDRVNIPFVPYYNILNLKKLNQRIIHAIILGKFRKKEKSYLKFKSLEEEIDRITREHKIAKTKVLERERSLNNSSEYKTISRKITSSIKSYKSVVKDIERILKDKQKTIHKGFQICMFRLFDLLNNAWSHKNKNENKTHSSKPAIYEELSCYEPFNDGLLYIFNHLVLKDLYKDFIQPRPPSIVIPTDKSAS